MHTIKNLSSGCKSNKKPIKWPPAEAVKKITAFCSQQFLPTNSPFLMSLGFFILLTGNAISPFVCSIQPASYFPLLPILLTLSYPSAAATFPISDAHQPEFTGNEIHPLFSLFKFCSHFYHSSHSSLSSLWIDNVIIASSLCCALWEFIRT